ncbi:MAG: aminodeoxychorismate/anthranilate synthase component II [Verrucomicrobiota bacterium]
MKPLVVIDNYDSFTYNLVQYFGELNVEPQVFRNDQITVAELREMDPDKIVISPGPGNPSDGGVSNDVIAELGKQIPVLGVCLGHQCICHVFGGEIVRAKRLMHGKTSEISHDGDGVFKDLPQPFEATRYHSLIADRESVPDCLKITAETHEEEIMGVRHKEYPIHGVQFHPESILSREGRQLLKNFLDL